MMSFLFVQHQLVNAFAYELSTGSKVDQSPIYLVGEGLLLLEVTQQRFNIPNDVNAAVR